MPEINDQFMRRALWATVLFNSFAAASFVFPATLGAVAGLPTEGPVLYRAFLALVIFGYGGLYAWLARSAVINRGLVAYSAIMKATVLPFLLLMWLLGEGGPALIAIGAVDLVFALIFFKWLRHSAAGDTR